MPSLAARAAVPLATGDREKKRSATFWIRDRSCFRCRMTDQELLRGLRAFDGKLVTADHRLIASG
jgi:hypothetical protein